MFYKPPKPVFLLLPLLGMFLFVGLYILAALTYPGGSWLNQGTEGFSFWNNYLCDLLDKYAINGDLNSGRYYARASLGVLCASLIYLWFYLPERFNKEAWFVKVMWFSGILALGITLLLSSGTHDITVRIAGFFGVIALICCCLALLKEKLIGLFALGIFCLLIFSVNYYIYESGVAIKALPLIQKITFVACLCWFVMLNRSLYKKIKERNT